MNWLSKIISTIFFGLLMQAPCFAKTSDPYEILFGYQDLVDAMQSAQRQNRPLETVEDVLKLIPGKARSFYTLVYNSHSLQDASPLFPRAIVFNGRMTFTFNGHPSQRGYNSIEIIEYQNQTKRFEMREIEIRNGSPVLSKANPSKCLSCHGISPRPLWAPYNVWPGVYGSIDDAYPTGTSGELELDKTRAFELKNLIEFKKRVFSDHDKRYSLLGIQKNQASNLPYADNTMDSDYSRRPNLLLSILVTHQATAAAAERAYETALKFDVRDLLLATLLLSKEFFNFYDEKKLESFCDGNAKQLSDRLQKSFALRLAKRSEPSSDLLEQFMELLGRVPIQKRRFYDDATTSTESELLSEWAEHFKELSGLKKSKSYVTYESLTQDPILYNKGNLRFNDYTDRSNETSICKLIKDLSPSLSRLETKILNFPEVALERDWDFLSVMNEISISAPKKIPVACIFCHTGHHPYAPQINFAGQLSFELKAKILEKINSDKMPPPGNEFGFKGLTVAEKEALIDFLK